MLGPFWQFFGDRLATQAVVVGFDCEFSTSVSAAVMMVGMVADGLQSDASIGMSGSMRQPPALMASVIEP